MSENPYGGTHLANRIRDSIVQDVGRAQEAITLLGTTSSVQARALAVGLGQAAAICMDRQPAEAQDMRRKIGETGRLELAQAFESGSGLSLSQPIQARSNSCFDGSAPASPEQLRAASLNPGSLLTENPLGGSGLSSAVRNLAISDPAVVSAIVSLIPEAQSAQKSAIGAGLGQAVTACELKAPTVAQLIQRFVAATGDVEVQRLFQAVSGGPATSSIGTASIGPGPAAQSGSLANSASVSTGFSGNGQTPQTTPQATFQFAVGGTGGSISRTVNRSISVFNSISP